MPHNVVELDAGDTCDTLAAMAQPVATNGCDNGDVCTQGDWTWTAGTKGAVFVCGVGQDEGHCRAGQKLEVAGTQISFWWFIKHSRQK